MAKTYKRREPKKKMPKVSRHNQIFKRRRSVAEKVMIVLGILIAISMVMSLVVSLASNGGSF